MGSIGRKRGGLCSVAFLMTWVCSFADSRAAEAADNTPEAAVPWWAQQLSFWRGLAMAGMVATLALAVTLLAPHTQAPEQPIVAILAGPDAKPAVIATMLRGSPIMTVKAVGTAPVPPDKALELWMLPDGSAPRSLGLIPGAGIGRVTLPAPPDVALANVPALAVSLEQAGGSTTGAPQGPVLYVGKVERFY